MRDRSKSMFNRRQSINSLQNYTVGKKNIILYSVSLGLWIYKGYQISSLLAPVHHDAPTIYIGSIEA